MDCFHIWTQALMGGDLQVTLTPWPWPLTYFWLRKNPSITAFLDFFVTWKTYMIIDYYTNKGNTALTRSVANTNGMYNVTQSNNKIVKYVNQTTNWFWRICCCLGKKVINNLHKSTWYDVTQLWLEWACLRRDYFKWIWSIRSYRTNATSCQHIGGCFCNSNLLTRF